MEEIQGILAELTSNGSTSNFLVHVKGGADTRVQCAKPLPSGIAEGDTVIVRGTRYPDPPFIADSVERVAKIVPKTLPWKWILIATAACVLIAVAIILLTRGGETLTVRAMDGSQPAANINVQLLDSSRTPLKSERTNSEGECKFSKLKDGTYYAVDAAGASVSVALKGSSTTATLPVRSPFIWTVRTTSCYRPAPNSPITLFSASNVQIQQVQSGANGAYSFANLKVGTYTARGPFGRSATAVIDGTTIPPTSVIQQQSPFMNCFIFQGKIGPQVNGIRPQSPTVLRP